MIFKYRGKTKYGEEQKGAVESSSRESAVDILQRQGIIIIDLSVGAEETLWKKNIGFFRGVSMYEVVTFSRQLSVLFEAKVPLVEALRTLSEQSINQHFRDVIGSIERNVDAGMPLSRAMMLHSKVFSNFYIALIKSGEISGRLQEVLTYLADYEERNYYLLSKARSAMIYPAFIIAAFIIIVGIMLGYIVPQLTQVFQDQADLPFLTRIIIGASSIFKRYILIFLFALIMGIAGLFFYVRTELGKKQMDILKLKFPIIKGIFEKLYLARFADTLGTMVRGGIPITQALEITSEVIGNTVYQRIITAAKAEVQKGSMISTVLKREKEVVPPLVYQMVYIGETSGRLDSILKNLSSFYQKELNSVFDNLVTLIEPILIVAIGVFVGIFVVSIIMPIYNIAETFG